MNHPQAPSCDDNIKPSLLRRIPLALGALHHRQHAKAGMTRAMGAGIASPMTDLDAKARQERMDQAYAFGFARP
ncbi:hypothetical protein LJR290_006581 [Variovorax sp. LjRoot290]|uniref:hypothetical protein n=1 Tax=unclassified Variovorax TaxID=663243 RepID=UPI003ECF433B